MVGEKGSGLSFKAIFEAKKKTPLIGREKTFVFVQTGFLVVSAYNSRVTSITEGVRN